MYACTYMYIISQAKIEPLLQTNSLPLSLSLSLSLSPPPPLSLSQYLPKEELYAPPLNIKVMDKRSFGRCPLVGTHIVKTLKPFIVEPKPSEAHKLAVAVAHKSATPTPSIYEGETTIVVEDVKEALDVSTCSVHVLYMYIYCVVLNTCTVQYIYCVVLNTCTVQYIYCVVLNTCTVQYIYCVVLNTCTVQYIYCVVLNTCTVQYIYCVVLNTCTVQYIYCVVLNTCTVHVHNCTYIQACADMYFVF